MTFIGTRPEVPRYVKEYTDEMYATLLLPAGVTSLTSILYKDEETLISNAEDVDEVYINKILPDKMQYNLKGLDELSLFTDFTLMLKTTIAVLK